MKSEPLVEARITASVSSASRAIEFAPFRSLNADLTAAIRVCSCCPKVRDETQNGLGIDLKSRPGAEKPLPEGIVIDDDAIMKTQHAVL